MGDGCTTAVCTSVHTAGEQSNVALVIFGIARKITLNLCLQRLVNKFIIAAFVVFVIAMKMTLTFGFESRSIM